METTESATVVPGLTRVQEICAELQKLGASKPYVGNCSQGWNFNRATQWIWHLDDDGEKIQDVNRARVELVIWEDDGLGQWMTDKGKIKVSIEIKPYPYARCSGSHNTHLVFSDKTFDEAIVATIKALVFDTY